MKHTIAVIVLVLTVATLTAQSPTDNQATHDQERSLARDIFRQLIEIDTTDSSGSTTLAAEAMHKRLLDAGFPAADVVVLGPNPRKGNLVARLRGRVGSAKKPVLLLGHIDVVEARREDWTTDPFVFTEKDGYFYGRGTQDMKDSAAAMVASFIRLKREGFVPDRDLILALTVDEEGGASNGASWLLANHRSLIDAAFVINPDAGGLNTINGKPASLGVEATEKLYADFRLTVTDRGGHSSLPRKDNAIYTLAAALSRLEAFQFPVELNTVTRGYFEETAKTVDRAKAHDMFAVLRSPSDPGAASRLSRQPLYNAMLRTTCVATMLQAGHAPNALPQRATANVNCRILPGHTPASVREQLRNVIANTAIDVTLLNDAGLPNDGELHDVSAAPPPLNHEIFDALHAVVGQMWPGVPVVPGMESGATDSKYTMNAGIPSYGFCGMAIDENDQRAHGRDERLGVESFYKGVEFQYRYLKALTGEGK